MLGRVGGGGMGEVYRADDLTLGQPVALKFLPESLAHDRERLGRLLAEVRLARQVSHRNVCRVYDIVEHEGQSFLSMEFVDGEDLGSLLRRAGRLAPEKAAEIARQICAGLHAAHEKGILHRDLKPANILVDSQGVAHIADFGLAGHGDGFRREEIRAGTPSYMSPEQVQGLEVTVRSDLYSLGLLLYEMYTGRRALIGKSRAEIEARRSQLLSQTSTELSALDPAVERVVARCLDPDPQQRPATALAVAAALPGGDPLAAALAAGELPSPEMIAASGSAGTLALPIGAAALVVTVVALVINVALAPHTRLHEVVGLPKSNAVLVERAAEIRRSFGYPDSLARHRVTGWWQSRAALEFEERRNPEAPRHDSLAVGQPSPFTFWVRESPEEFVPSNLVGSVNPSDPPRIRPDEVLISLSPEGELRWFHAVPPRAPRDPAHDAFDPTPLFPAAGLDFADFEVIPRNWNPIGFADEVHTFRGHYRDRPGYEIEVRIGAYETRPVWFDIVDPWELEMAEPGARKTDWTQGILQGMVIFLILSAALLTRRNVRLGQGDRRGAARLARFAAICMAGSLLLSAHHVAVFQPEWNMINVTTGIGLVLGGLTWLIYIALEPFARRTWPETLISWSRLLQGRLLDPRVGRDLLLGIAVGSILGVARPITVATFPHLGQKPIAPGSVNVSYFDGFLDYLGALLSLPLDSVWIPMAVLLLAIGIRVLVRKKSIAIAVSGLFFSIVLALGTSGPLEAAFVVVGVALFLGTLFRLGLLAMMTLYLTTKFYADLPFTADLGTWYAWPSVVTMLGLVALAIHGFRLSRRPV